jgi:filamentous hemagglutinin
LGQSAGAEGQFWSLESPLNLGYAARYGIPEGNQSFDFIETGILKDSGSFVTRTAPGGSGIEVATNPGGAKLGSFTSVP